VQLFRNDRVDGVRAQLRRRQIVDQCRIFRRHRTRGHSVAEADIDLRLAPRIGKFGADQDPSASISRFLANLLRVDRCRIKNDPILGLEATGLIYANSDGLAIYFDLSMSAGMSGILQLKGDATFTMNTFGEDIVYTVPKDFRKAVGFPAGIPVNVLHVNSDRWERLQDRRIF